MHWVLCQVLVCIAQGVQTGQELSETDGQTGVSKGHGGGKACQANGSTRMKNHSQERRPSLREPWFNASDGTLV